MSVAYFDRVPDIHEIMQLCNPRDYDKYIKGQLDEEIFDMYCEIKNNVDEQCKYCMRYKFVNKQLHLCESCYKSVCLDNILKNFENINDDIFKKYPDLVNSIRKSRDIQDDLYSKIENREQNRNEWILKTYEKRVQKYDVDYESEISDDDDPDSDDDSFDDDDTSNNKRKYEEDDDEPVRGKHQKRFVITDDDD